MIEERTFLRFVRDLDEIFQQEIRSIEHSLRTVSHDDLETRQGKIKGIEAAREMAKKHADEFMTPKELRVDNL